MTLCADPRGVEDFVEGMNAARRGIDQTEPFLSLGPVLHLTIAERPILAASIHEIDPHVFFSHPSLRMDLISDLMEEFLLHLGRSPADPGDLDDDEIARVVQAEISLFRVNDLVRRVPVDDLKLSCTGTLATSTMAL